MSACMSDVDLATLHKCRLDQRIKYQLSAGWVNRRQSTASSGSDKKSKEQPTADECVNTTNNSNQPSSSVIQHCDCCCCCYCSTDNDTTTKTCGGGAADDDNDVACGSTKCACQRSSAAVANSQVDGIKSGAAIKGRCDGGDKRRKVEKCKHAVISCRNEASSEGQQRNRDKDSYLTRRRSGTWP